MGDDNPQQAMTDEEREEILELYDGLRVADVTDGLDYHGFHNQKRVQTRITRTLFVFLAWTSTLTVQLRSLQPANSTGTPTL